MNTIQDIWEAWTTEVQLPGTVTIDEATDIAQTFAPTLSDADGNAWWDAVAVYYGLTEVITPGTYVGLRNYVNNNKTGADLLFAGLPTAINSLPESQPVNDALQLQNVDDQLAEIPQNILDIEALKTGGTSVKDTQFDRALDEGIAWLRGLEVTLQGL